MEYDTAHKHPYRGFFLECIILVLIPLILYGIFWLLFSAFFPLKQQLNELSARALGFGLGTVVHIILYLGGVFNSQIHALRRRIRDFFDNAQISMKIALKCHLSDLVSEGLDLWVYSAIILACATVAVNAVLRYIALYVK